MTQSEGAGRPVPAYQLEVSRIFGGPPAAVCRAFTDAELRAQWVPAGGRSIPDPSVSAGGWLLTWAERSGQAAESEPAVPRTVRVQLHDEPGGKTRLDLLAGPYSEARESEARAWWDSAFSHLDNVLERLA
jgi:hypothetical protein